MTVPFLGTRKLVIKNLRPASERAAQLDEHHSTAIHDVTVTVTAILEGRQPDIPYGRIYRRVEDLCRQGLQEQLYGILVTTLRDHVQHKIKPDLLEIKDDGGSMLSAACSYFGDWSNRTVRYSDGCGR